MPVRNQVKVSHLHLRSLLLNICSQLQGREQEDLAQTCKKSIKRQQRIVSVHTKVFRVFTRHCCQPSASVLRSLNSQPVWLKYTNKMADPRKYHERWQFLGKPSLYIESRSTDRTK